MKKTITRIYNIFLFLFVSLIITGCNSGGGGGGGALGFLSDAAGSVSSGLGGSSSGSSFVGSSSHLVSSNPEPSSILLLSSGLIGMAIYAKARLKSKNKK